MCCKILICLLIVTTHRSCLADDQTGSGTLQLQRLETAFEGLLETVESLKTENQLFRQKFAKQQLKIKQLRSEVKKLSTECSSTNLLLQKLNNELHSNSRGKRQFENEEAVAFYGKLNVLVTNISQNEIIKFNNIVTDIGNAYHSSTGMFTAPVPGVYFFSVTVMVEKFLDTHVGIYVNNQMATNIKLHGTEHEYDTMSQSAVYYLIKGDNVSVRHYEGNKTLHGDYTSLTAFLLYQDYGQLTGNGPINVIG